MELLMAQWIGQDKRPNIGMGLPPSTDKLAYGMDAMGRPVPLFRQAAADRHMKQMGVTSAMDRTSCIGAMVDRLQRDDPYNAMGEGMRYVDLTGTYRLMAVLLAEAPPPGYYDKPDIAPGLGTS
jgi:hypothetical protein